MKKLFDFFEIKRDKLLYFFILLTEKIILVLSHIYFINFLNRDLYGLYNQINFLSNILVNISLLGTLIPIVIKAKQKKDFDYNNLIQSISFFFILIVFILASISFIFKENISNIVFGNTNYSNYIILLFTLVVIDLYSEIFIQKARISNSLIDYSSFALKKTLIRLGSLFIIFSLTNSFFWAIFGSIFSLIVILYDKIYFSWNKTKIYINTKKREIINSFIEGFSFLGMFILSILNTYIINFILAYKFKLETLAVYNFNYTLATFPLTFINYIIFYSLPKFNDSRFERNTQLITTLKDLILAISILIISFLIISFFYEYIISNITNDASYSSITLFRKIYILNIITTLINFIQFPLLRDKKFLNILFIQIVGVILTIVFIILSERIDIYFPINSVIKSNLIMLFIYLLFISYYAKRIKKVL